MPPPCSGVPAIKNPSAVAPSPAEPHCPSLLSKGKNPSPSGVRALAGEFGRKRTRKGRWCHLSWLPQVLRTLCTDTELLTASVSPLASVGRNYTWPLYREEIGGERMMRSDRRYKMMGALCRTIMTALERCTRCSPGVVHVTLFPSKAWRGPPKYPDLEESYQRVTQSPPIRPPPPQDPLVPAPGSSP